MLCYLQNLLAVFPRFVANKNLNKKGEKMVHIVADTLSSIPVQEAKKLKLPYLPQIIIFGEDSYKDDSEIDPATFLEKLKTYPVLPKTAAPYPVLYNPIFEELSKTGEPILVLCPPKEPISGTVRSAETAKNDFPNAKIFILDTTILGAGLGTLVRKALEWAEQGDNVETIIDKVQSMAAKNRTYFLLDTLEYLRKGGRIGAAKALVGGILQMKPLLAFRNSQVEPVEQQRTKAKAVKGLIDLVEKECPKSEDAYFCIQEGDNHEEALQLSRQFSDILGIKDIPIYKVPPAILVHGGPGVIGVSYFVN
jgi:DegV family protein with EDD domain